jgi:MerR family transcriptional regulator, copper efflux regulator
MHRLREGGFRLFGLGGIETLKFVQKAQELGFSLNEIRELLILRSDHAPACSRVKELLEACEQKISELQDLERSLKRALQSVNGSSKAHRPVMKSAVQCSTRSAGWRV